MLTLTDFSVDVFNFAKWDGPPPTLVQQQGEKFTKAGTNDIGRMRLGQWGRPFDVELTAYFIDRVTAEGRSAEWQDILPYSGWVQVRFAAVNYFVQHFHVYHVDRVEVLSMQQIIKSIGLTWAYDLPFEVRVRFTMSPQLLLP